MEPWPSSGGTRFLGGVLQSPWTPRRCAPPNDLDASARLAGEFEQPDTAKIAIRADPIKDQRGWLHESAAVAGANLTFPVFADQDREILADLGPDPNVSAAISTGLFTTGDLIVQPGRRGCSIRPA